MRADNPAPKYVRVAGGAVEMDANRSANRPVDRSKEASSDRPKLFDREKGRVFVHPASVNFGIGKFDSGWLVYTEVVETSKVFVRECSMVPIYAMLLFGGELEVNRKMSVVTLEQLGVASNICGCRALGCGWGADQWRFFKIEWLFFWIFWSY